MDLAVEGRFIGRDPGRFVVSRSGEVYDTQARGPNRKFRILIMKRQSEFGFVIALALLSQGLPAQESKVDGSPHYRLLQIVELATVQEKFNETAAEGYRLVGAVPAPGGTWAAI